MGLRRRLALLLRARVRGAQTRDEDPLESLDRAYSRELATADAIRQGVAAMVTASSQLRIRREALERERPRLEETARGHLRQGREDLAAAALTQAELLGAEIEALVLQEGRLDGDRHALDAAGHRHQARLALLRSQREALGAQYTADRARIRASEALAGLRSEDTATRVLLERARERMLEVQARADALGELARRQPAATDADVEARLTSAAVAGGVARRLASLRGELGLPPATAPRLPERAAGDDAEPPAPA
jgi:phage shock protein A